MIKVLVVEDEAIIRKGLIHTFDWSSLGYVIVAEAANGEEGLSKIIEVQPQLVITDIKMPKMSGLEMVDKAKQSLDFETIIISSYSEFEYAKTAMDLKIGYYLLKPIDEKELKITLTKVKEDLETKRLVKQVKKNLKPKQDVNLVRLNYYMDNDSKVSQNTKRVITYIKENYQQKINIEQISEDIGVSASYLSRIFKQETTKTFHEFLNQYRIQQSIQLLLDKNYKVYEVSEMVGFNEYKHFSTVFKKYMSCLPLNFIKQNCYVKEGKEARENQ